MAIGSPLPSSPSESPSSLAALSALAPEQVTEQIDRLTDADLDKLMGEIERDKHIPAVFENAGVLQGIEHRLERNDIQDSVRAKWQALKAGIEQKNKEMGPEGEKKFLEKLVEKGGGWAIAGTIAITVLAWFGFKGAKSIKEKGFLRSAIEGAKEHPILFAFLAAMGIKAGSEAFHYFTENRTALEGSIAKAADALGISTEDAVLKKADELKAFLAQGADQGLRGIVKGTAFIFGGEYNEETGVVTLPRATLRPPVIIAWQAGIRRRGGPVALRVLASKFLIEDKLNAILRQTDVVTKEIGSTAVHKKALAKRALELMKKSTTPGNLSPEELELERILKTLEPDLNLKNTDIIHEVKMRPDEAKKRVAMLEAEMERLHNTEIADFNRTKDGIDNELFRAEKDLASGNFKGSAENVKANAIEEAQAKIKAYTDDLTSKKVAIGQQMTDALQNLSESDAIDHGTRQRLGVSGNSQGKISGTLEGATRTMERWGYNMKKVPGGKWVMRGVIGYSFLPLALEGVAALRAGEKGGEATKALVLDAAEAGLGFIPGAGEVIDFKTAIMGTDFNGREVDTWGRVTAGVMGTLGVASIGLGFFTGGLSVVGFKAIRGAVAARRAVKIVEAANAGKEVATVTNKSIKAVKTAEKNAEKLEKMLTLTDAQRKAAKARDVVHNAQRAMQIVTYGHLGIQMASGLASLYTNTEELVGNVQEGAINAVDSATSLIRGTPSDQA